MPRSVKSLAGRVLEFFQTAPIEIAQTVFDMARDTMREREVVKAAPRKRRKRTLAAVPPAPAPAPAPTPRKRRTTRMAAPPADTEIQEYGDPGDAVDTAQSQ